MEECLKSDQYDGIIVISILSTPQLSEDVTEAIKKMIKYDKPVLVCTIGGPFTVNLTRVLEAEGIPVYPTPHRASKGMAALYKYSRMKEENGKKKKGH